MKWLMILIIMGFFYPVWGQEDYYKGTWKGTSLFITTKVIFKDGNRAEVHFKLSNNKYIQRSGAWKIKEKMVELLLNYEETDEYKTHIKNVDKWYKHKFALIGDNKGMLIDDNTSTYTVYKTFDKKGKKLKRPKKKI